MPCYDYVCTKCHHKFEALRDREVKDSAVCEKCQAPADRVISRKAPASIIIGYCYNNEYVRKENWE